MTTSYGDGPRAPREEVGSLAQEAAKLFAVLQEWAGRADGDAADDDPDDGVDADRHPHAHADVGASECSVCPVCRLLRMVRGVRPEAFGHLADAVDSLAAAARELAAGAGRGPAGRGQSGDQPERASRTSMQHIDIG